MNVRASFVVLRCELRVPLKLNGKIHAIRKTGFCQQFCDFEKERVTSQIYQCRRFDHCERENQYSRETQKIVTERSAVSPFSIDKF